MMNDEELLKFAAKAEGFSSIDFLAQDRWANVYTSDGRQSAWNPLIDDGDALRLSVKLCMRLEFSKGWQHVSVYGHPFTIDQEILGNAGAAARRAVVRAAAELGKSMP